MNRLEGKVAVITGASSGFGRAMALRFAGEGAKIVCADLVREMDKNDYSGLSGPTDEEIVKAGGQAVFAACDITSEEQVQGAVKKAVETYGRLDIMVCNAGVLLAGKLMVDTPVEWLDKAFNINVRGTWFCCQAALKQMLAQNTGGRLIINASISAVGTYPLQVVYNMSKAAAAKLAQTLALECGPANITCNALAPTVGVTSLSRGALENPHITKLFEDKIPLGRWLKADELANVALFLASDEASFINGVVLPIDGGETVGDIKLKDMMP